MKAREGDEFALHAPSRPMVDGKRVRVEYISSDGMVIYVSFQEAAFPYQLHQVIPISVNELPETLRGQ